MLRKIFLIGGLLFAGWESKGQDPQFSQFYACPLYLNPGFAGTAPKYRVNLQSRIQWPSLPQAFVTHAFSMDDNVEKFNSGFGLLVTNDRAGTAALQTTSAGLIYAYKFYLGQFLLCPGIDFAYTIRSIDRDKLISDDQLQFGSTQIPPTIDPELQNLRNTSYFDFTFGTLLYNQKMWFGFTMNHLNRPNLSFVNADYRLPRKFTAHAGFRIPLNSGMFASDRPTFITPSIIYRVQGQFTQMDVGINYYYQPVNIGIWYRGIPVQRTVANYLNSDALIFLIGFSMWNLDINYSYDFTISQLGPNTNGAHEVSLSYLFDVGKFRKLKEKHKKIPCPAFYNNGLNLNLPAWFKRR